MIIRGRFIGDAPYFAVYLQSSFFQGLVWFLVDTGASRTTLLDRDMRILKIPRDALEPSSLPVVGIGGSVRSFMVKDVELTFSAEEREITLKQNLWVVQHDLEMLPPEEVSRILRLPSVLGRDLINKFSLSYDYQSGLLNINC